MAEIMTYNEAREATIIDEMRRNPDIFFIDRAFNKARVEEFGWEREKYTRSGINENQMVGAAIGASMAGARAIAYPHTADYSLDAITQIVVLAAKMHFKLAYKLPCPAIFWLGWGGVNVKTVHHAGCYHNWMANAPGLFCMVPSMPADAAGLWRTALCDTKDPTIYMEDRGASGSKLEELVPDGHKIPFGVADVKREGNDVTIAAVGYMVHLALDAAEDLAKEGIDAEVWDPRTLSPFDHESLVKSVRKTGAMVAVDQAPKTFGTTGEFTATVAEAITPVPPMARVATWDVPIGAAPSITDPIYPSKAKIIDAVKGVLARKG